MVLGLLLAAAAGNPKILTFQSQVRNSPSSDTWASPPHSFLPVSLSPNPQDLCASYGTAKSGVGICSMGVLKPELIIKSIVPIIMAGILGIYGLIVSVILQGKSMF